MSRQQWASCVHMIDYCLEQSPTECCEAGAICGVINQLFVRIAEDRPSGCLLPQTEPWTFLQQCNRCIPAYSLPPTTF